MLRVLLPHDSFRAAVGETTTLAMSPFDAYTLNGKAPHMANVGSLAEREVCVRMGARSLSPIPTSTDGR